jgi:tetratricopeptide (TPR) repeat protein
MCNRSLVRPFTVALTLTLTLQTLYARAIFDIGEGREDPLIVALQKYEPKLWSSSAADILALINREGTCTLIQFLSKDANGDPDIQLDGQGNLITRDKYGKRLAELRKVPADRLKQDLGIVIAFQRLGELNPETRKQLNVALYGPAYEKGPQNDADRSRGAQRLKDGMLELSQYRDAKKVEKLQAKARQASQSNALSARSRPQEDMSPSQTRINDPAAKKPTNAKETEGMAQRTLAAYNAFYNTPAPQEQLYSNVLISLQNVIRQLNFQGVDPDLISFFRFLDQEFTEEIPVLKAWEVDESKEDLAARVRAGRDEECRRARELGEDCERDAGDALSVWQNFLKFSGRASNASGTGARKWGSIFEQLEAKYKPLLVAPLKRLETRYELPFYSNIFDAEATKFYEVGQSYNKQNKYSEAVRSLKSALGVSPNYPFAHTELGYAYEQLGEYSLAIAEFEEQLRLKVQTAESYYSIGWCYSGLKRYSDALGFLKEAIRLKPELTEAHEELGYTLQHMGRLNQAIEQYETVVKRQPGHVIAHYHLGQVYLMMSNRGAALDQYRILQKLDAKVAAELYEEINGRK